MVTAKNIYYYQKGVPTFALIILAVGVIWLLSEIGVFRVKIPWWPVILIALSLGWIINYYVKK